ncbi:MAG: hypothetical protein K0S05_2757 [Agromyces sp.]|jgi:hypothetical protein|nr:hypothetical protein [Agromyces sp.]
MTDDLIQFEGGEVLANLEDRTITGLLIPFGEEGRTNIGRFMVEAGAVELPADPSIVSLNLDHDRSKNVGRAVRLWEEPRGVMATYSIAKTTEGDAALADALDPNGKRRKLSGEFGPAMIRAGKLVAGHAKAWGSALVEAGAFPSAQVLAADTPDVPEPVEPAADSGANPEHLEVEVAELPADITATTPAGDTAIYTPEPAPAETNQEGGSTVTATAVVSAEVRPASIPATLLSGASAQVLASAPEQAYELGQVFGAMAQVKGGIQDADAMAVLAALSDIKVGTLDSAGVVQHSWVGKVWQGKTYARKFIDLATHGTNISIGGKKGFKLDQGTALVAAWAGNKVELPSGTATTTVISSTLRKYGFAADIAREFYDLPGGAEVIEAFVRGVVDSYAKVSDLDALNDIVKTAAWNGSGAFGSNVLGVQAPGTYPTQYTDSLGQLIQGIEAVTDADDTPSFAIANAAAWNELIYTPKDLIPEFVSFNFNTDGTGTADGKVTVVKAPASGFTLGANVYTTAPAVVVGAKQAIEFDEIGETPVQLDALDIAKGGIDKAVIGYLQTFIVRPESVVLVGTKNV